MELTRKGFLTLAGGAALALTGYGYTVATTANAATTDAPISQAAPADVEIVDAGYYFDKAGNGHYAVLVKNDNAGSAATGVSLSVTALGSDGQAVSAERATQKLLLPLGTSAVCGTIAQTEDASSLAFKVHNAAGQWTKTDTTQAEFEQVVYARDLDESVDALGFTAVSGELANDSAETLAAPDVNVVFRDADGTVLGGASTTLQNVPAGSTAHFAISHIANVPDHATVEAYVNCSVNA